MQFDEEDQEFGEDFLSDEDPSILHFLLAGGDEVRISTHKMSAALERGLTVHCQATCVAAFSDHSA